MIRTAPGWYRELIKEIVRAGGKFERYSGTGHAIYSLGTGSITLPNPGSATEGDKRGLSGREYCERVIRKFIEKHKHEATPLVASKPFTETSVVLEDLHIPVTPEEVLAEYETVSNGSTNHEVAQTETTLAVVQEDQKHMETKFYCDTCDVSFSSSSKYTTHCAQHLRRGNNEPIGSSRVEFYYDDLIKKYRETGGPFFALLKEFRLSPQLVRERFKKEGIKAYARLGHIFPDGLKTWEVKRALAASNGNGNRKNHSERQLKQFITKPKKITKTKVKIIESGSVEQQLTALIQQIEQSFSEIRDLVKTIVYERDLYKKECDTLASKLGNIETVLGRKPSIVGKLYQ